MSSKGIALITGASSGIGAIYADRLAKRGYDLILVARREDQLNEVARAISGETGRAVEIVVADLTNATDLARVEQTLRTDARITAFVNNAGSGMSGTLADADPERLEWLIRLNVLAPTRLAAAAISRFVARGRGTLINISSATALMPERINGVYSGTKAFLLNLTLRLRKEVADTGIQIQVVLPGAVRTAIWEKAGTDIATLPPEILMDADAMVDAALVGLDNGEVVTIPSLPELADWEAYEAARWKLVPNLSRRSAARRYDKGVASTASS